MEKIIIFGTGKYYQIYKKWIVPSDIVVLADNNTDIQGSILDGHKIISPIDINRYIYDRIYILSISLVEIRDQLLSLGISEEKIYYYFQLKPKNSGKKRKIYYSQKPDDSNIIYKKRIIMISHDLSITGAPKCLLLSAELLIKNNYSVVVGSPYEGDLKKQFLAIGADVVVDEQLRTSSIKAVKWMQYFDVLFINTVQLYYLLLDRDLNLPIVWWIHEPEALYKSVIPELIDKISKVNLRVYTVSKVAEQALHKFWNNVETQNLIYGIPDSGLIKKINKNTGKSKMRFVTIGGMSKIKGYDILLEAVSLLTEEEKEASEFFAVGISDTYFGRKIVDRIQKLDLPVIVCGEMDNQQVLDMLSVSDVLICPSRVETMSMAVTEALMMSIPVIVSGGAGIADYIEDGYSGFLFGSENSKELKEHISFCINNKSCLGHIAKEGRNVYLENFTLEKFERQLLNLYYI